MKKIVFKIGGHTNHSCSFKIAVLCVLFFLGRGVQKIATLCAPLFFWGGA